MLPVYFMRKWRWLWSTFLLIHIAFCMRSIKCKWNTFLDITRNSFLYFFAIKGDISGFCVKVYLPQVWSPPLLSPISIYLPIYPTYPHITHNTLLIWTAWRWMSPFFDGICFTSDLFASTACNIHQKISSYNRHYF